MRSSIKRSQFLKVIFLNLICIANLALELLANQIIGTLESLISNGVGMSAVTAGPCQLVGR